MALQNWWKCYIGKNINSEKILKGAEIYADQINTPTNIGHKTKILIEQW